MTKPENMKVLIVDDYSSMRRTIRSILEQNGVQKIHEAENGKVALSKLNEITVDIVILDWQMPEMTGIELLRRIRATDKIKTLPILMVTAESEVKNVVEAVKAGVNNYVVKPFDARTLMDKIQRILQTKK